MGEWTRRAGGNAARGGCLKVGGLRGSRLPTLSSLPVFLVWALVGCVGASGVWVDALKSGLCFRGTR